MDYYCIPKQIMPNENYSVETKMLFAMLLSDSEKTAASVKDLMGIADLLKEVGSKGVAEFRNEIRNSNAATGMRGA